MTSGDPSPDPAPLRARRWSPAGSTPPPSNRWIFRLIGIPALAIAGVLIYRGVQDRFFLPECDSSRAKTTLAGVLKDLKSEPLRYEPIKTVSSSKERVVCYAALPLPDGSSLDVDYTFFWQGSVADMKYSIARRPADNSTLEAPRH